jgi:hypothetical protein
MKLGIRVLLPLGVAATLSLLQASAQGDEALELARRLVLRSGMATQLHAIPIQFEHSAAQHRGRVPAQVITLVTQAGKEAFQPAKLHEEVVRGVASKMSPAGMRDALEWLESDIGRRITAVEEAAATSVSQEAMTRYLDGLKTLPPSKQRVKLIGDVMSVANVVESSAGTLEAITLGIAVGFDAMQPLEKQAGADLLQLRLRESNLRGELLANLGAALPALMLYTYRDVSDADLSDYVSFMQTPAGTEYTRVGLGAIEEALVRGSYRMGQLMQRNVPAPRTKT